MWRVVPRNVSQNESVNNIFPQKSQLRPFTNSIALSLNFSLSLITAAKLYPIETGNDAEDTIFKMGAFFVQLIPLLHLQLNLARRYTSYANLYNSLSNANNTNHNIDTLMECMDLNNQILQRQKTWLAQAALANALLNCSKEGELTPDLAPTMYYSQHGNLQCLYALCSEIKFDESFLKNWKIEGNDTPLCIQLNYELHRLNKAIERMRQDETYENLRINPHKSYLAHNTQLLYDMSQDYVKTIAKLAMAKSGYGNTPLFFKYFCGNEGAETQNTDDEPDQNQKAWRYAKAQLTQVNHSNNTHESAQAPQLLDQDNYDTEDQSQTEDNQPNNSIGNYLTSCLSSMFSRCCPRRQHGLQRPLLSGPATDTPTA